MSSSEYVGVLMLLTVLYFCLAVKRLSPAATIVSTAIFFNVGMYWIVRFSWSA